MIDEARKITLSAGINNLVVFERQKVRVRIKGGLDALLALLLVDYFANVFDDKVTLLDFVHRTQAPAVVFGAKVLDIDLLILREELILARRTTGAHLRVALNETGAIDARVVATELILLIGIAVAHRSLHLVHVAVQTTRIAIGLDKGGYSLGDNKTLLNLQ